MITNYGWTGVVKGLANAQPRFNSRSSKNGGGSSHSPSYINMGTVDAVTNQEIGEVVGTLVGGSGIFRAIPLIPNIKSCPVAGEQVVVFYDTLNGEYKSNLSYYIVVNVWNNPSLNSIVSTNQITQPQNTDYFDPEKVKNIVPLSSLPGDVLYEGRFGNSIRLGNSNPNYPNGWSKDSQPFEPITILSNGQSTKNPTSTENINSDLSSIYLTSYQKLSNFNFTTKDWKSSYNASDNVPIPENPDIYSQPQIVLNSDRVVINSKKDSVLINGLYSVGLFSNNNLNMKGKNIYIDGVNIQLGPSGVKTEPVLKGDTTVDLLEDICKELKNLAQSLTTLQIWPAGVPAPDPVVSKAANTVFSKLKTDIIPKLETTKSSFVKVK
jgi:hypothetical protein